MAKNENIVIPTLDPEDIEVKIKQVSEKGALALLYKTARTDMRILDEMYGVNNWQVDYQMIGDMLFCTISIWDDEKQQWIRKQSNGIESREDGEGNEKKGWSSDSMKRAGFMLGIGRELYSSPFIWLNVETERDKFNDKKFVLKDRFAKFVVTDIEYDNKRKINKLVIANQSTGEVVYKYGGNVTPVKATKKTEPKSDEKPKDIVPNEVPKVQTTKQPNVQVTTTKMVPNPNAQPWEASYRDFIDRHKLTKENFIEMRARAVKEGKQVTAKSFKELTSDEWNALLDKMEALYKEGYFKDVE